jgi:hypothetical protein
MTVGFQTTSTRGTDAIIDVFIKEHMVATNNSTLMGELAHVMDLPDGHDTLRIPFASRINAQRVQEAESIRETQSVPFLSRELGVDKYGVMSVISAEAMTDTKVALDSLVGKQHGEAHARLLDEEGLGLHDGWSMQDDKSASPGATITDITRRCTLLRTLLDVRFGQRPHGDQINATAHPLVFDVLIQNSFGLSGVPSGAQNAGTLFDTQPVPAGMTQNLLNEWWKGKTKMGGVNVFVADNAKFASDESRIGVWSRSGIALVRKKAMQTRTRQDIESDTTVMVSHARWGFHRLVDVWGGAIRSYCDTPSYTYTGYTPTQHGAVDLGVTGSTPSG